MRKPLTIRDEPQPRNITRADLVMTEGFGLELSGMMMPPAVLSSPISAWAPGDQTCSTIEMFELAATPQRRFKGLTLLVDRDGMEIDVRQSDSSRCRPSGHACREPQ